METCKQYPQYPVEIFEELETHIRSDLEIDCTKC